jgi:hypothetical protein
MPRDDWVGFNPHLNIGPADKVPQLQTMHIFVAR